MSLKKFLESSSEIKKGVLTNTGFRSGQAIVEYFILLVLLAAATIIGSSLFYARARSSVANFASNCFETMGQNSIDLTWENEEPWWGSDNGEVYIPIVI